jgi:VanZ family protein
MAWSLAAFVVFATLGPQSLRPHLPPEFGAQAERFGAYFVTAAAFALAYPTRKLSIAGLVVFAAIILEIGQAFSPGRDPGVPDAIAKALGGLAGVIAVAGGERLLPRQT